MAARMELDERNEDQAKAQKSELGSQDLPMWPVADLGGEGGGAHPACAPLFGT